LPLSGWPGDGQERNEVTTNDRLSGDDEGDLGLQAVDEAVPPRIDSLLDQVDSFGLYSCNDVGQLTPKRRM
jgi:hypothetical protein